MSNRAIARRGRTWLALAATACLFGCATQGPWDPSQVSDPLEPVNRGVFWVNDKFDVYLLTPAAKGWDFVAPDRVQTSLSNFFTNLRFPIHFLNDVLQGKPVAAGSTLARFVVNTTAGVAGLFDPASRLGLARSDEDFGQTMGVYGIPSGPYLVLPILGPSSLRDAGGSLADAAASVWPFFVDTLITVGVRATDTVNARSRTHEEIEEERRSAFDWYTFVRDAYLQRRHAQVRDEQVEPEAASDAQYYYPAEDEEAAPEAEPEPEAAPQPEAGPASEPAPEAPAEDGDDASL
jgi:phospholipid-binding lipoprotein MlaA